MKKIKKLLACFIAGIMVMSMVGCSKDDDDSKKSSAKVNYVASFYPMYILTLNLTDGIDDVSVSCMADMNFGCIHDYTMKTDDLKNIEKADAFIENGFDLEPFNDKIEKAYPKMKIVKSSDGINIKDFGYEKLEKDDDDDKDADTKDNNDDSCCGSNSLNPHIWTDVSLYIEQVKSVTSQLKEIDSDNADKYQENCDKYLEQLNTLKGDMDNLKAKLNGQYVLVLDETLPNMCHSLDISYDFIETDHDQQSLSAAEMKDAISEMKEKNSKAILMTKNSDDGNAKVAASETKAKILKLNSCMVGKKDKDSYIKDMKENIEILSSIK